MLCQMSHVHLVTCQADASVIESSQHFAPLQICVKMFHAQYYLVATVIHTQSLRSEICVCIYTHILHSTEMLVRQKKLLKNWSSRE